MTDWDEFMEPNSGRKFYYNAKVTPIDSYRGFQKSENLLITFRKLLTYA